MELYADRLLIAVLLKHHDLGHVVMNLSSSDRQASMETLPPHPRCLVEVCKVVHQARTALIKVLPLLICEKNPTMSIKVKVKERIVLVKITSYADVEMVDVSMLWCYVKCC